jgi:hypothetical protein
LDIDRTDSIARFEDSLGRIRFAEISVRARSSNRLFLGGVSSVEEFVRKRKASELRCGVFYFDKKSRRLSFLSDKRIDEQSNGFLRRSIIPDAIDAADSFFAFACEVLKISTVHGSQNSERLGQNSSREPK